jgi:hypothetical protein
MLANIAGALDAIRIQADIEAYYSPFGFERSDLDALNPYGRLSDVPSFEKDTGRSLFFLADEENQFLLDGCFVTFEHARSIGLISALLSRLASEDSVKSI